MRGICNERPLSCECLGQAVEHVVEGLAENPHLMRLICGFVNTRMQVARVDARGHRGHPAQRTGHARADQISAKQRRRECKQPGEDERARHATLGLCDARHRLPDSDYDSASAREPHGALEQTQVADVWKRQRSEAERRAEQVLGQPVLGVLLGSCLVVVGRLFAE